MAFGIAAGSIVKVCSNSNIWGSDVNYKRKHIGNSLNEINNSLENSLNAYESISKKHLLYKEKLANIQLSDKNTANLIGNMYLVEDLLTENQVSIVKKEFKAPSFDYGVLNSAWNLYNHCTHALKESRPNIWHTSHIKVCDYFEKQFKLN